MAIHTFRKQWSAPPPIGTLLNLGHPMAQGARWITRFECANDGTSFSGFVNLVDGMRSSWVGAGTTAVVSERVGQGVSVSATAYYTNSINARSYLPTDHATVFLIRRKTDTTLRAGFTLGNGNASDLLSIANPYSDGIVYWDFGGSGAAPNRLTWSGYSVSTVLEYWTFVAGANGSSIYFNGQRKANSSTAISRTGAGDQNWYTNALAPPTAGGDVQEFYLAGLIQAEWSDSDVWEWYRNPWQLFAPTKSLAWRYLVSGPSAAQQIGIFDQQGSSAFVGQMWQ